MSIASATPASRTSRPTRSGSDAAVCRYLATLNARGFSAATLARKRREVARFRSFVLASVADSVAGIHSARADRTLASSTAHEDLALGAQAAGGSLVLAAVTAGMARAYRRSLSAGPLSVRTWAARFAEVKLFFAWLLRTDRLLVDPFAGLGAPSPRNALPAYLTQAEVRRLLEATSSDEPAGLRDRAVLETLYSSGLRLSELVRLDLTDADLSRGLLFVRQGKGNKDRVVPVGRIAARLLERYVKTVRVPAPSHARSLFLNDVGQRLSHEAVGRVILPHALLRARIQKHVTPHVLRHSCAIHLLENGASVRYVQALLGHARLHTTQKYLVVVPVQLQAVHRASHPAEHQPTPEPTAPTKWVPSHRKRRALGPDTTAER